jgi:hypothetical protein
MPVRICAIAKAEDGTVNSKNHEIRQRSLGIPHAIHLRMNLRQLSSALGFTFLAYACGGTTGGGVIPVNADAGRDGDPPPAEIDGSVTCVTSKPAADVACVPGLAPANTAITIDVMASEGCLGCFTTLEPCSVTVSGKEISVSLTAKTCAPNPAPACPAVCGLIRKTCEIPALPVGEYAVRVFGESAVGYTRTLVVEAANPSSKTSCSLPPAGQRPDPLDGSKYSKSCSTDADCEAGFAGDLCGPCAGACPNIAFSKSEQSAYSADYRARRSQCTPIKNGPSCAPCVAPKISCDTSVGVTGMCKIAPN